MLRGTQPQPVSSLLFQLNFRRDGIDEGELSDCVVIEDFLIRVVRQRIAKSINDDLALFTIGFLNAANSWL